MTGILLIFGFLSIAIWATLLGRRQRLIEFTSNRDRGSVGEVYSTTLSSLVGGWMFFGLNAIGYEAGMVGAAIGLGYAIGLFLLFVLVPRIKSVMSENGFDTLDEFIGLHFGRGAQTLLALTNFGIFLSVLAAQFMAMTSYLSVIAPEFAGWLPLAAASAVVVYTSIGGYKGVAITDILKMIVLVLGVGAFSGIVLSNTPAAAWQTLPATHRGATGYGVMFLIGAVLFFPATILVRSDLWQRVIHAESPAVARRALALTIPSLLLFYIVLTTIGMASRARLGAGVPKESSGLLLLHQDVATLPLPAALASVLIAVISFGIFAALASTADNNLNIASLGLSKLLFAKDWKVLPDTAHTLSGNVPSQPEQRLLQKSRLLCFVVGIVSIGGALLLRDIVAVMVNAAWIMMLFLPATLGALLFNHRSSIAGTASILSGLAAYFGVLLYGIELRSAFLPGVLVSFAVYATLVHYGRRAESTAVIHPEHSTTL
jgi:Na+/proline symporter